MANNRRPNSYYREKIQCNKCGVEFSRSYMPRHKKGCKGVFEDKETNFLTEIKLKSEADKMVEKIEPKQKKEDNKEYEYECGQCGNQFNGKVNHCSECGVYLGLKE